MAYSAGKSITGVGVLEVGLHPLLFRAPKSPSGARRSFGRPTDPRRDNIRGNIQIVH
jgi:hypothetical protein